MGTSGHKVSSKRSWRGLLERGELTTKSDDLINGNCVTGGCYIFLVLEFTLQGVSRHGCNITLLVTLGAHAARGRLTMERGLLGWPSMQCGFVIKNINIVFFAFAI